MLALLAATLGTSLAREQLDPISVGVVVALTSLSGFRLRSVGPRGLLPALLVLHTVLVASFLWSLGEVHHIDVRVAAFDISASIDGDTVRLPIGLRPRAWGFQQTTYDRYRYQATGEAVQSDTSSLVGRIAEAARQIIAQPAWTNARIVIGGRRQAISSREDVEVPTGSWSTGTREEWRGNTGAYVLFPAPSAGSFHIRVDLARPEGEPAIILATSTSGAGFALQARFDQPDVLWTRWDRGRETAVVAGTSLHHMEFWAGVRRAARLLLLPYVFAVMFMAFAVQLYLLCGLAFYRFGVTGSLLRDRYSVFSGGRLFVMSFAFAVLFAGLLATESVSTLLLSRIPHVQDSVAYLFQAKIFAAGRFNVPAPPPAISAFFREEYMPMFHGRWFSQYPPGHPLILALGVLFHAPWLVGPLVASAGLALTFVVGRLLYGNPVGVLAALLGLTSPFWLFLGSSFMSHDTGMFFGIATVLCFAQVERGGNWRWAWFAGFFAGMLFITRQLTTVGLLWPVAVYALISWRQRRSLYLHALIGIVPPVAFLLIYNWVQMGFPLQPTYAAWDSHFHLGFGDTVGPNGPFTPGDGAWGVYFNLSLFSSHMFGWPYGVALAFACVPFLTGSAHRWDFIFLGSFLGVVCVYAFYWCGCTMYGPRFYYEAIPPVLLLTSRGIVELGRLSLRMARAAGWPVDLDLAVLWPAVLVTAFLVFCLRFYLPAQWPLYSNYNYSSDAELQTVSRAGIHNAIVFVVDDPPGFWASYGNVFFENDPFLRGDIIYARDFGSRDRQLYRYWPGRVHYRLHGSALVRM